MNLEEQNTEKRKNEPLTFSEWLTFFFLPFYNGRNNLTGTDAFNELEEERFKKFGFEKKRVESEKARWYGCLFYVVIFLACIVINWII